MLFLFGGALLYKTTKDIGSNTMLHKNRYPKRVALE